MLTLLLGILIAVLCGLAGFWLRLNTKLTVVEVSAMLALVAGLILPRLFSDGSLYALICTTVSYAAMCSKERVGVLPDVLMVSILCALVVYFGQGILVGVGGRLGTSAAISVLLLLLAKTQIGSIVSKDERGVRT